MFDIVKIIEFFKKTFTRKDVLFVLFLIALYFFTRLINLDKWPIFSDEGIYIRWAKVAWRDASWRFISLTDGKQPLQTWGTIPFLKLFPDNALLAGRLFSVATGFVALTGIFSLFYYLWGKKAALIGSLIYVLTPYFIFYDRMALVDSGVNAGFIWILFFSILLARTQRLDVALLFGLAGGFALLAKSSARIFVMLSAFAPLLIWDGKVKKFILRSVNYFALFVFVLGISLLMYNIQRLSPFFHYVDQKNTTFVMTFSEWLQDPFAVVFSNLRTIPTYVFWELGWVVVIFSALGFVTLFKQDKRLFIYFLIWLVLPYISIALFARVLFPRYLIFLGSLLVVVAVAYFSSIKKEKLLYSSLGFLLFTMIIFDYPLLFNPVAASFPPTDRGQYVEGATAVWGAEELMQHVRNESKQKPAVILAEGNFGLVADVLDVFLRQDDRIEIRGIWPLEEKDILAGQKDTKDKKVFVVFSHREEFPPEWPIKLVKKYTKPGNERALYLYEYK